MSKHAAAGVRVKDTQLLDASTYWVYIGRMDKNVETNKLYRDNGKELGN